MPIINSKIHLISNWSVICVLTNLTGGGTFTVNGTKHYSPMVTFSTQDNPKLLQQLKSTCHGTINWNRYQSKDARSKIIFRQINGSKFPRNK